MVAKKNVVVLGCGLVGRLIARDLQRDKDIAVTVADQDERSLAEVSSGGRIATTKADLSNPDVLRGLLQGRDLAVGCLPGFLGLQTLRTVISCGVNYADICFMPEDPMELDAMAAGRGVSAVVDCGVAPGLSNLIAGHVSAKLDRPTRILILVGGLPAVRHWPFEYKAVFSPIDVIEEYTRPARYVEYGHTVERPALTDVELVDLPGVGTLEAFNTDGLRSLARTLDVPFMKEKTLRYPGHAERMRMLRDAGFFSYESVEVKGQSVKPIDLTARLIFSAWKMGPADRDLTVMRVVVEGVKDGRVVRHTYDLLDRYDEETGASAMSRTTGFPCAIAARMLLAGEVRRRGVVPPELIGREPGLFERFMSELDGRGIRFDVTVDDLGAA